MKKSSLLLLVCALSTLVFHSCNSCNDSSSGKKKFFRYNHSSGISSLDPAFSKDQSTIWTCNQLYNSLVQLDDNLNTQPSVAKSWEISDDGKVYTFHLRNDV